MSAASGDSLRPVLVHESVRTPQDARVRALRAGGVDPAWHYTTPHQAELWWRVHTAHAPGVETGTLGIYQEAAAAAARRVSGPHCVVALASGGGEKEALVLAGVSGATTERAYVPVDIGLELALRSADRADGEVVPVVGDLAAMDMGPWLARQYPGWSRTVTAYGITPNMLADTLLPRLIDAMGEDGQLLVSANLLTDFDEILPQYDNAETRRWLNQLTVDWGLDHLLGPMTFEAGSIAGEAAVIVGRRWRHDEDVTIDETSVRVGAGDVLRLFYSIRYTPESFERMARRHGLTIVDRFIDGSGQEGVWLLAR